jgi:membrane protein
MQFFRTLFSRFLRDRCTTLAAALAYYTVFALPPLLYLLMMILTFGMSLAYQSTQAENRAEALLMEQTGQMLGNPAATEEIGRILRQERAAGGLGWKSLLSLAGILVGATGVVVAIQDALNLVWEVEPAPERGGVSGFFRKRLLSLAMILGLGFLLLVSLVVSTVLEALGGQLESLMGMGGLIASGLNYVMLLLVTTALFAALFKFMPDAQIAWRDVWLGAIVTAVLFLIGRLVLQFYLSRADPGAHLGSAAASLAVLLVWVYYSAIIFLLGAEFTQVFANRFGGGVTPEAGAVRVKRQIIRPEESA